MILIFEMVCIATGHAATNSATIQTIARAFPEQPIRVFAHDSHLKELRGDPILLQQCNVSFRAISISRFYMFRPHIVSLRRGLQELWTLLVGLKRAPANEACLIVLISATPTAIFAASLLARLMRRQIRVQVCLHGNLNDAFGWRSRNPLARLIDLYAALTKRHGGRVRFLVLEEPIRRALVRLGPVAAETVDVLPHPISPVEVEGAEPNQLSMPLRVGLVGQATRSKGIQPFLALARYFRQAYPDAVCFHIVGNAPAGSDMSAFAVLNEPVPTQHISRTAFLEKLQRLHYVCLLLQPGYYELSASGALMDAIVWLRPIIATGVPIISDMFKHFGDIGELCDDVEGVRSTIIRLASFPDPQRYERQVANLRRARASRLPASLASQYRRIIDAAYPGLSTDYPFPVTDVRTLTAPVNGG